MKDIAKALYAMTEPPKKQKAHTCPYGHLQTDADIRDGCLACSLQMIVELAKIFDDHNENLKRS